MIMKKLFLLPVVFFTVLTINAQFGVNAGVNFANWGGSDATAANLGADKKVLIGPHFGVYYNAEIGEHFSVQPEVGFSAEGVKLVESGVTAKVVTNYICIGALARWNSGSGFYLGTGPQLGLLMSAELQADGVPDEDVKDDLKSSDFAWMFRAGYNLPGGFGFYAGFNLGLGTIDGTSPPSDFKNRVIQLGIRYNITKGGSKKDKD